MNAVCWWVMKIVHTGSMKNLIPSAGWIHSCLIKPTLLFAHARQGDCCIVMGTTYLHESARVNQAWQLTHNRHMLASVPLSGTELAEVLHKVLHRSKCLQKRCNSDTTVKESSFSCSVQSKLKYRPSCFPVKRAASPDTAGRLADFQLMTCLAEQV